MSWTYPSLLWLLVVVAALPLWWSLQRLLALRGRSRIGVMQAQRHRGRSLLRRCVVAAALVLGWAALVVALAGPRVAGDVEYQDAEGYSIMTVLDCSYSMQAQDLYPSRMRHAHFKVHDLLRLQPRAEVGLLPFAGIAALRSPLTTDHTGVRLLLEDCTPDLFQREDQGTAIGTAVQRALVALQGDEERGRVIIILSDGDDPDEDSVRQAAQRAAEEGVTIYGVVMGDPDQESTLRLNGQERPMSPTRATLDLLSEATGGLTVFTTSDDSDIRTLVAHMQEHVQAHSWRLEEQLVASERYQWPLAVALLLFAIALLLPTARRPLATLLLLAVMLPLAPADEWGAQVAQAVERSEDDADAARAQLDAVLLERPDHPAAHYNRALLSAEVQRRRYHLRRAADSSHAPIAAAAHHHLARMALDEGRYNAAQDHLQQAVQRDPQTAEYQTALEALQEQLSETGLDTPPPDLPRQLPPARVDHQYAQNLLAQVQEGARIRLWGDGQLPQGLALSADGRLHGSPQNSGVYRFRVVISDAQGERLAQPWVGLHVLSVLRLEDADLPPAVVGEVYQYRLEAQGALAPDWSLQGLPPGMRAQPQGDGSLLLRGIPEQAGDYRLQIQLRDRDGAQLAREASLLVAEDPVPDRLVLPAATRGADYRHQLSVRGPNLSHTWQAAQAGGLQLDSQGLVRGSPEQESVITLGTTLADSEWQFTVPVNPRPALILPEVLVGIVGRPERWRLPVRDGTPPFRLSVAQGDLPAGIRLREDGVLLGAAQEEGDYPITVMVVDRWQALARSEILLRIRERSAAHEEEPPPQDEDDDQEPPEDDDDGDAGEAEGGEASDDDSDGSGEQAEGQDAGDDDQVGEQDQEQEADAGEQPQDQEDAPGDEDEGPLEDAQTADEPAPDRSRQEARRWLDEMLDQHKGDLDQSLRDFMRHSGEGSGDERQPW